AVETTKLSLLLKALEGENDTSLSKQMTLFHERALPNLSDNIKCGNSLIASDFSMLPEDLVRVNAFDWPAQFPDAMKAGGFDAVIGNPPYVRPHNIEPEVKDYFWAHFHTFVKKSDIYCCFIEQGISLLQKGGAFGFIVSDGWLRLDSFQKLRQMLLSQTKLQTIIDFTDNVFEQASVKTLIMILVRETAKNSEIDIAVTPSTSNIPRITFKKISQNVFSDTYKQIFDLSINPRIYKLKRKINESVTLLGQKYELSFGLKTGDDSIFLTNKKKDKNHKPLLRGANIHRYLKEFADEYVWYVPDKMRDHRKTARPGTAERFEQSKVLIRDTGGDLEGTYDDEHFYVKDVLVISLAEPNSDDLKYLCGILNSRLMKFYYEISFPTLHVQRDELASLPIRTINFTDPTDKARHDRMVALVEKMLALTPKLRGATSESEKAALQNAVTTTDAEIDRLVYELYGLTKEEIKIVEVK
ncbi:MAG: Eco57I restriction-modification methylase domain-containing protein, partial [Thermodesulfovibrionales bacterium]|nr:Eco57I restriction-modification methylase domain-containing protein [Thermodesulfovibrionales bacterium]